MHQLRPIPDGKFLPPMKLTCAETVLKKAVDRFGNRRLIIGRTAILTENHGWRKLHVVGLREPTITMMALTARACAFIAEEMRRGNL